MMARSDTFLRLNAMLRQPESEAAATSRRRRDAGTYGIPKSGLVQGWNAVAGV
jgi:hypothetical protein